MGEKFLIDTNVLIDYEIDVLPKSGEHYIDDIIDKDFTISFISYIEFLGYKDVTKQMNEFAALAKVIEINKSIIEQTILIRKSSNLKLPDAIIAATAIVYSLTLISRNTKDFKNIIDLKFINPYKI